MQPELAGILVSWQDGLAVPRHYMQRRQNYSAGKTAKTGCYRAISVGTSIERIIVRVVPPKNSCFSQDWL